MAHGAHHSPTPPPHADPGLARDCEQCLGWGTVITRDGEHELCGTCQSQSGDDANAHAAARVVRPPTWS
ncbi:hypothetical protein ABZ920_13145 [Streptomyces sp. NPDC046831]|uniref:hypothetical protein n=1 Tax=Streptomyces sp. NPDC046831 TaxID=3154805 RepID=UPI0033D771D0